MSVSTVTALPQPQWRIMNRLNARTGKPATAILERCDASLDDLIALHERELITGRIDDGEVDLGLLVHDRGLLRDYDIRILLTTGGAMWVEDNPSNCALTTLDKIAGRRPARLTEVAAAAGVDAELFLLLEHAGLVTFSRVDGGGMRVVGTTSLRFYRNSLLVLLTARAIEIID